MTETITRKVVPKEEQQTINLMATFGWELMQSQEINSTDSHLERRGDTIYNVTTKENYVKLVFKRNKNMRNYNRIVELEGKYYNILKAQPQFTVGKVYLAIVVGLFTIWLAAIPGIVIYYNHQKKFGKEYRKWQGVMNTTGASILNEARQLL